MRRADHDDADALVRSRLLGSAHGIGHAFETRTGSLQTLLPAPPLRLRQVHAAQVHTIRPDTELNPYAAEALADRLTGDALITRLPGRTLAVATADCLPVLFADPDNRAVGAAHAGWRGVALGVLPATLGAMAREFGTDPARCLIAVGPAVGARRYRVGPDVVNAFEMAGIDRAVFTDRRDEPQPERPDHATWSCDLAGAAAWQLGRCGVVDEHVALLDLCTCSDAARFHSYRRDADAAGRMLSGIAVLD